jgi:hypothetical protein
VGTYLAAIATVVLLLILALARTRNPDRYAPEQTDGRLAANAVAAAKSDDLGPARKPPESERSLMKNLPRKNPAEAGKEPVRKEERKQGLPKETQEEEPRETEPNGEHPTETPRNTEPKKSPSEPRRDEASAAAKQLRLRQVRQLLYDAQMARERGKHLDAVLGFGQAAILYPDELAELEDPEKVRLKFIEALKQYQTQVEQVLQKAAAQKTRSK